MSLASCLPFDANTSIATGQPVCSPRLRKSCCLFCHRQYTMKSCIARTRNGKGRMIAGKGMKQGERPQNTSQCPSLTMTKTSKFEWRFSQYHHCFLPLNLMSLHLSSMDLQLVWYLNHIQLSQPIITNQ